MADRSTVRNTRQIKHTPSTVSAIQDKDFASGSRHSKTNLIEIVTFQLKALLAIHFQENPSDANYNIYKITHKIVCTSRFLSALVQEAQPKSIFKFFYVSILQLILQVILDNSRVKTLARYLRRRRRDLSPQQFLKSITILCKLFDTFMKLIESNLILKEVPTKFRFIINEGNLGYFVGGLGGYL